MDEDERVHSTLCQQPCGDHRLAESSRRGDNAGVVMQQRLGGGLLVGTQLASERDVDWLAQAALVTTHDAHTGVVEQTAEFLEAAAWEPSFISALPIPSAERHAFRRFARRRRASSVLSPSPDSWREGGHRSIDCTVKHPAHDVLHPGRKGPKAHAKVFSDRHTSYRILEDHSQGRQDRAGVRSQHVLQPVQSLNDAHGWATRPVELAWRRELELDREIAERNRTPAHVGVDDYARRDGGGQAQVVGGRQTVDQHAGLIAPGKSVQDLSIVRRA